MKRYRVSKGLEPGDFDAYKVQELRPVKSVPKNRHQCGAIQHSIHKILQSSLVRDSLPQRRTLSDRFVPLNKLWATRAPVILTESEIEIFECAGRA